MAQLRTGGLIVATHELVDPNFAGTVVLLLDHDDDGTIGVVLNRPSQVQVAETLPDRTDEVTQPRVLFTGGPVATDTVIAVGSGPIVGDRAWQPVTDGLGIVDLTERPPPALTALRVFLGYAGWAPGQLAGEIDEGAWWVVDTAVDDLVRGDLLSGDPATLWRRVLTRQGGLFRTVPDDPTMN